ncbi:hypothetical protein SH139x_002458 [Planctomycetaceae bacterium SH139]
MSLRLMIFTLSLAALCNLAGLSAVSTARDLIVDNVAGSDSQNDRGQIAGPITSGPYRTINRALLAALPGDRIILTKTGEPYRECVSLVGWKHSGSPARPFEIVGNGATLDGSVTPAANRWRYQGNDVWELMHSPAGYGLFAVDGRGLARQPVADGDLSQLSPLTWTRIGPRMYLKTAENLGPADYALTVTEQTTGLTLYDVQHVMIRDLVVRGYRLDGINIHDRCEEIGILDVSCRQNGRAGITVAGASQATIGATLADQNGQAQLRVEGRAIAYLGNVDFAAGMGVATLVEDAGRIEKLAAKGAGVTVGE